MFISIWSNPDRDIEYALAREAAAFLLGRGISVAADEEAAAAMPQGVLALPREELCAHADVLMVIGGDGTILSAAEYSIRHSLPMFCINKGRLGFLSQAECHEIDLCLERLISGEYTIEKRLALQCEIIDEAGETVSSHGALNEFYVRSVYAGRLVWLNAQVGPDSVGSYAADGMIVSSPTGSTGYSLSAGGPIIAPDVPCMVLTPICAHNLQAKPLVISADSQVELFLHAPTEEAALYADGRYVQNLERGYHVHIRRSSQDALFVRFDQKNFFALMKQKLSEW